ncbi:unnamed protein product, partial [Coregonus sp. 'balchen']
MSQRHRKEKHAEPTSRSYSLCGRLWVSASLDIIRRSSLLRLCLIQMLNNRTGIIRRSDNEKPQSYEFPRPARFGAMDSLILPRVRPEDAGTYQCLIRANIGQTNRVSNVTLNVSTDCVIQTTVAVTAWQDVTHSTPLCTMHVVEVSVIWTSCGFLILGLVKIALCLTSIEWSSATINRLFSAAITTVSSELETLTSMSAAARLHRKTYMGEWRFLFFTTADITKMFSRRLTIPRVRNTSAWMWTGSHRPGSMLVPMAGPVPLLVFPGQRLPSSLIEP